ncbi:hypothetical protein AB0K48_09360, partial [Nonomuraea sp. NPDC055795]
KHVFGAAGGWDAAKGGKAVGSGPYKKEPGRVDGLLRGRGRAGGLPAGAADADRHDEKYSGKSLMHEFPNSHQRHFSSR